MTLCLTWFLFFFVPASFATGPLKCYADNACAGKIILHMHSAHNCGLAGGKCFKCGDTQASPADGVHKKCECMKTSGENGGAKCKGTGDPPLDSSVIDAENKAITVVSGDHRVPWDSLCSALTKNAVKMIDEGNDWESVFNQIVGSIHANVKDIQVAALALELAASGQAKKSQPCKDAETEMVLTPESIDVAGNKKKAELDAAASKSSTVDTSPKSPKAAEKKPSVPDISTMKMDASHTATGESWDTANSEAKNDLLKSALQESLGKGDISEAVRNIIGVSFADEKFDQFWKKLNGVTGDLTGVPNKLLPAILEKFLNKNTYEADDVYLQAFIKAYPAQKGGKKKGKRVSAVNNTSNLISSKLIAIVFLMIILMILLYIFKTKAPKEEARTSLLRRKHDV